MSIESLGFVPSLLLSLQPLQQYPRTTFLPSDVRFCSPLLSPTLHRGYRTCNLYGEAWPRNYRSPYWGRIRLSFSTTASLYRFESP